MVLQLLALVSLMGKFTHSRRNKKPAEFFLKSCKNQYLEKKGTKLLWRARNSL
jgi:hypothetical protein